MRPLRARIGGWSCGGLLQHRHWMARGRGYCEWPLTFALGVGESSCCCASGGGALCVSPATIGAVVGPSSCWTNWSAGCWVRCVKSEAAAGPGRTPSGKGEPALFLCVSTLVAMAQCIVGWSQGGKRASSREQAAQTDSSNRLKTTSVTVSALRCQWAQASTVSSACTTQCTCAPWQRPPRPPQRVGAPAPADPLLSRPFAFRSTSLEHRPDECPGAPVCAVPAHSGERV